MFYIFTEYNYELSNKMLDYVDGKTDIKVIRTKELCGYSNKLKDILCKIFYILKIPCKVNFSNELKKIFCEIKVNDVIVIWGSLSPVLLFHFAHFVKADKKIVWLWNSFFTYNTSIFRIQKLKKYYEICTFDSGDAKKYSLKERNQVCYQQILQNRNIKIPNDGIYFVGQDKGRYDILEKIYLTLNDKYKCDFRIIEDSTSLKNHKVNLFGKKVSFEENINNIGNSRCVVEIMQEGQSGITLRALEALISKRKLLTTNIELLKAPFYCKDNIFIINKDENFDDFMSSEFNDFFNFEDYLIQKWILNLKS